LLVSLFAIPFICAYKHFKHLMLPWNSCPARAARPGELPSKAAVAEMHLQQQK